MNDIIWPLSDGYMGNSFNSGNRHPSCLSLSGQSNIEQISRRDSGVLEFKEKLGVRWIKSI